MEHHQVEDRPAGSYRGSGDDPARFLRELRQLRDGAGLEPAELAARAHYPYDRIKAAEVGPTLPDLPVLSAYVRGCGGTIEEWEERWRSLTSAPTLPLVDARPAGGSTAASAGARIGSISPVADTPDPSIIMAALDRVAEQMAVGTPAPLPSRSGVSTIDQRPGIAASSPAPAVPGTAAASAAAAAAAAAKSAGGKAGTGKVSAWETTTMRTAWSSAAGPDTRRDGAAPGGRSRRPAGRPRRPGLGRRRAVPRQHRRRAAGRSRRARGRPATRLRPRGSPGRPGPSGPLGGIGSGGPDGSGQSAAAKPFAAGAARAGSATRTASGPITVGRRSGALSRTTVAALIAIAVCVLVALVAIIALTVPGAGDRRLS